MNSDTLLFWLCIVLGVTYLAIRWRHPQWATPLFQYPILPALMMGPFAIVLGVCLAAVGPALWLSLYSLSGLPAPDLDYAWRVIPLATSIYFHVAIRFFLLPTVFFFVLYPPLSRRFRWMSGTFGVVLVALAVSLSNDFIGQRAGIPPQGGAAWLLLGGFVAAMGCLPLTRPGRSV